MPKTDLKNTAIFMPDSAGVWRCVFSSTPYIHTSDILAHICEQFDCNLPDACQFARLVYPDYHIEYRAYGALRITISINPLN